jgi:hypothetical protein
MALILRIELLFWVWIFLHYIKEIVKELIILEQKRVTMFYGKRDLIKIFVF